MEKISRVETFPNLVASKEPATVYDVACKSIPELVYLIMQRLNETIEHMNKNDATLQQQLDYVLAQLEDFYLKFDEDLRQEIQIVLQAWIEDGTLEQVISQLVENRAVYPSIPALQQAPNIFQLGAIVELQGYHYAGDGAGHKRIIADVDDGSGVAVGNKFALVFGDEALFTVFGAVGDDKTDNTIAQRKASAWMNSGTKTLVIPAGIFQVSDEFDIPSNTILKGYGRKSVLKIRDNIGNFYTILALGSKDNVVVDNVAFDTNHAKSNSKCHVDGITNRLWASACIYMHKTTNVDITNCYFKCGGVWVITMDFVETSTKCDNINISNNVLDWIQMPSDPGPHYENDPKRTFDATMIFSSGKNVHIKNNTFNCLDGRCETAIELHGQESSATGNTINNTFVGVIMCPEHFAPSAMYPQLDMNQVVSDNIINTKVRGVHIWPYAIGRELAGLLIANNKINMDSSDELGGIGISTLWSLEALDNISKVVITGNSIKFAPDTRTFTDPDYALNFTGIFAGYKANVFDFAISNNTVINAPGCGIAITASADKVAERMSVVGNTIIAPGSNSNITHADYSPRAGIRISGKVQATVNGNAIIERPTVVAKAIHLHPGKTNENHNIALSNNTRQTYYGKFGSTNIPMTHTTDIVQGLTGGTVVVNSFRQVFDANDKLSVQGLISFTTKPTSGYLQLRLAGNLDSETTVYGGLVRGTTGTSGATPSIVFIGSKGSRILDAYISFGNGFERFKPDYMTNGTTLNVNFEVGTTAMYDSVL